VDTGGKVLELVLYKLEEGVSRERFLDTNDDVSSWISKQPGFISRDLVYDAEGDRWVDVVWWETMESALSAGELAMTSDSCAPMFGLIEMKSAITLHGVTAITPVLPAATVGG
jgi:hypothetical protein